MPPPCEGLPAQRVQPENRFPTPCCFPRDGTVGLPRFVPTSLLRLHHGKGKRAPQTADKQLHGARSCPGKARNNLHTGEAQISCSSSVPSAQEACPDTQEPNLSQKPSCAAHCSWEQARGGSSTGRDTCQQTAFLPVTAKRSGPSATGSLPPRQSLLWPCSDLTKGFWRVVRASPRDRDSCKQQPKQL